MEIAARFIALAHRDLPFLEYSWEFCGLAAATALDDATILSLFWHGANSHRPVDLPDTTRLKWRDEILRCLESVQARARTSLPSLQCPCWSRPALQSPCWSRPALQSPCWFRPALQSPCWSRPALQSPCWFRPALKSAPKCPRFQTKCPRKCPPVPAPRKCPPVPALKMN